jgi:hypothetical protein
MIDFKCSVVNQFTLLSFLFWDLIYLKLSSHISKIEYLAKTCNGSNNWFDWSEVVVSYVKHKDYVKSHPVLYLIKVDIKV